jgi:hypothetical protein
MTALLYYRGKFGPIKLIYYPATIHWEYQASKERVSGYVCVLGVSILELLWRCSGFFLIFILFAGIINITHEMIMPESSKCL